MLICRNQMIKTLGYAPLIGARFPIELRLIQPPENLLRFLSNRSQIIDRYGRKLTYHKRPYWERGRGRPHGLCGRVARASQFINSSNTSLRRVGRHRFRRAIPAFRDWSKMRLC